MQSRALRESEVKDMVIEHNENGTYTLKIPNGTVVTGDYRSVKCIADLILDAFVKALLKE